MNQFQMVGSGGMSRTNAMPGPNMLDSGAGSKPFYNSQPENNERLMGQNIQQNTVTAAQQAASGAVRVQQNMETSVSDQEIKAQEYARESIATALYANDAGSAMMKLNAISQSPDNAKFMNDLAVSKAMSVGSSPDLGAAAAQSQMYS